jgi:hypothetical protein
VTEYQCNGKPSMPDGDCLGQKGCRHRVWQASVVAWVKADSRIGSRARAMDFRRSSEKLRWRACGRGGER